MQPASSVQPFFYLSIGALRVTSPVSPFANCWSGEYTHAFCCGDNVQHDCFKQLPSVGSLMTRRECCGQHFRGTPFYGTFLHDPYHPAVLVPIDAQIPPPKLRKKMFDDIEGGWSEDKMHPSFSLEQTQWEAAMELASYPTLMGELCGIQYFYRT